MTMRLSEINSMDAYLKSHGPTLARKAITSLSPLHIPGESSLPDFDRIMRRPFVPQQHVIAAIAEMLIEGGSGFLSGEMGVGKSLIGCIAVDELGRRSRKQGGKGGRYRAMILCPDHLIDKWKREIESTIPDVEVFTFDKSDRRFDDSWTYVCKLMRLSDNGRWQKPKGAEWYILGRDQVKRMPGWAGIGEKHRGFNGDEAEGRSLKQVKIGREVVKDENGDDAWDDKTGKRVYKSVIAQAFVCPSCGHIIRDAQGVPVSPATVKAKQLKCDGRILRQIPEEGQKDLGKTQGFDRRVVCPTDHEAWTKGRSGIGTRHKIGKVRYILDQCNEPLWNYVPDPRKWAPARIIQKKLKRLFDYLVIDEVHEQKSDESGQSMAAGKLMASVPHVLAMTGTLIGGYANHLFPLMMRMTPHALKHEGFQWGRDLPFSQRYGRVDKIITLKEGGKSESTTDRKSRSMRRAKGGTTRTERLAVRPGIMPDLFGRHLLGSSVFISLEEMADELPALDEFVNSGACDMDPELETEYKRVEELLVGECTRLLQRGSMKLCGAMLATLMDYPDRPWGWEPPEAAIQAPAEGEEIKEDPVPTLLGQAFLKNFESTFDPEAAILTLKNRETGYEDRIHLRKDSGVYYLNVSVNGTAPTRMVYDTGASCISMSRAMADSLGVKPKPDDYDAASIIADGSRVPCRVTKLDLVRVGVSEAKDVECTIKSPKVPLAVGYWEVPKVYKPENWRGVVTPRDLNRDKIYRKEQKLIDICKANVAEGRQVWVYVQMTGKRDVQSRLANVLEQAGMRVGILRRDTVSPRKREEWIEKNGKKYDVVISHPQLVQTGLDLFSKREGGHNFSSIIFYETGYKLFTLRQAARRAWRIGQMLDCRVYYLYYKNTMQHRAMDLMSRKLAAATALEGEFSTEGLVALAGEDNAQMALARSLSENIADEDMQRNWGAAKVVKALKKAEESGLKLVGDESIKKQPIDDFDDLPAELQLVGLTLSELDIDFDELGLDDEDWLDEDDLGLDDDDEEFVFDRAAFAARMKEVLATIEED